jgi:hypothetical protein
VTFRLHRSIVNTAVRCELILDRARDGRSSTASVYAAMRLVHERIMSSDVEAFFSVVLLAASLWAAGVLVPMARRNHDVFGIVCAIAGAVIALAAWLLIGTGVRSQ